MNKLGWKPFLQFEEGLGKTVDWYLHNEVWLNHVTSGTYQEYYFKQYSE
jgi:dTDP-glucose 4,6-dehydratase